MNIKFPQKVSSYIEIWLIHFTRWRLKHISAKNFLILASMVVGVVGGLTAVLMKSLVHHLESFLKGLSDNYHNYLYFFFPAIGIFLTVLFVQLALKGKLGRGISNVLYSVARKKGVLPADKSFTHIITSALTIGFGGSAGLEAPIVVTGSAIGSNMGRLLHLTSKERILLLACGTAAGVSAIFNSPIAGVVFAFEVLLVELTVPAFIPLLIASATATVVSKMLHTRQLFHLITEGWVLEAVPYYVLFGVFCGLLSVYVSKTTLFTENWISEKKSIYLKAVLGGLTLGGMIFLFPPLYGEGYSTIENLFQGTYSQLLDNSLFSDLSHIPLFVLFFSAILIFIKVIATSITISCGGNGGIFATTMMTGALAGFFCSYGLNNTTLVQLNETNFIAVGMAGLLSGVIHAPLTAIFLIAEITGGYVLFVPLMIVSATSFFIARYMMPHTIYTKKLIEKGDLLRDKDKAVLGLMNIKRVLEKDFVTLNPDHCLRDIVSAVSKSRRNVFPVVDEEGKLKGVLFLDDIREIIFQTDKYDCTFVREVMETGLPIVDISDNMLMVMKKFEEHEVFNLPVVDNGTYKGFISKSNIFTRYRSLLIEESQPIST